MADESLDTQRRLALIETRLEGMENRISGLEERLRVPVSPRREALERLSQPAPLQPAQPQPTPPPRVVVPRVPTPPAEPNEPPRPAEDIEFKLGANLLLRGGAVVVVIGICYLVALAVQRGVITPAVQFVGEIALCLAFIGIGWWKRAERVEFGHLMIGIGSAGLFASFAAGYAVKHLFDGSTAILAFTVLSLANLAFADLRSTRSFLALGMIGGLVAAVLPVRDHHPHVGTVIHFLILIPTLAVAVRRRWLDMTWLTTTGAALSLWALFDVRDSLPLCQGAVAASTLLCAFAIHMLSEDANPAVAKFQSLVPLSIGGLAIAVMDRGAPAVFTLAAVALALSLRPVAGRARWSIGSIAFLALIPPVALPTVPAATYWITSSIAVSVATWFLRSDAEADLASPRIAAVVVSTIATALSALAYVRPWDPIAYTLPTETALLCGLIASIAVTTIAAVRWAKEPQPIVLVAIFVASFPFGRLGVAYLAPTVYASLASEPLRLAHAVEWPLLLAAVLTAWLARAKSWREVDAMAWAILVAAGAVAAFTFWDGPRELIVAVPPALSIIAATTLVTRFSIGLRDAKQGVMTFAALYASVFVARLAYLVVGHWFCPDDASLAFRWSGVVVGALAIGASRLTRDRSFLGAGWIALTVSTIASLSVASGSASAIAVLVCALIASAWTVGWSIAASKESTALAVGGCILLWVQATLLGDAVLPHFAHVRSAPAMSISWTVFASALMVAGFRFSNRTLRLVSFAAFGATLIKVFAFDLTDLDPGVRVAVLLLLGIAMLFAGYRFLAKKQTD